MLSVGILLYYIIFALFLLGLWLIKIICDKDYVSKWILEDKVDESDGTDS